MSCRVAGFRWFASVVGAWLLAGSSAVWAADPPAKAADAPPAGGAAPAAQPAPATGPAPAAQPAAPVKPAEPPSQVQRAGGDAISLEVPEGTIEDLLKFIETTRAHRPQFQSREEFLDYALKAFTAIGVAADKILANDQATEAQLAVAVESKYEALTIFMRLRQPGADEQRQAFLESLDKNPRLAATGAARLVKLQLKMESLEDPTPEQLLGLWEETAKLLAERPADPRVLALSMGVARLAEQSDQPELAATAYQSLIDTLTKTNSPFADQVKGKLEGTIRRLKLVGQPLELEGTLLDGKPLDWSSYKGKVVLVDFWATWCGPCIAELPNVLKAYEAYHDRGFEVLGISLDDDRAALEEFVAEQKLPWPTVFSEQAGAMGWETPMAVRYGVQAIPMAVLVDASGKVVSLHARGPALEEHLEKLLGPAKQPSAPPAAAPGGAAPPPAPGS